MTRSWPLSCSAATLLLMSAPIAAAADASSQNDAKGGASVEEVVVTANRIEQNIQKVPTAVTAFSGNSIKLLGFKEGFDLSQQTPNFTVSEYGSGHPIVTLAIRGVGTIDANPMNDPSVSFYVDDVYQAVSFAGNEQLFDVQRAEVLKGPQGTLFGRNSTGGLVQFITHQPTDSFEAYVRQSFASFDDYTTEAAMGGPIAHGLRFRLAGDFEDHGGVESNPLTGEDRYGSFTRYAGRLTLDADLAPDLDLAASVHYGNRHGYLQGAKYQGQEDPNTTALCNDADILASKCVDQNGFRYPLPNNTTTYAALLSPSKMDNAGGYVKVKWTPSWGEINSITGYEWVHAKIEEYLGPAGFYDLPLFDGRDIQRTNFSEELRANGHTSWGSWIVGAYYYRDRADLNSPFGFETSPVSLISDDVGVVDAQSVAGFGEVNVNITSKLSAFGGVRYTSDSKNFTLDGVKNTGVLNTGVFTGRVGLQYQATRDIMVYVKYSRGYKSGGFGFSPPPNNVAGTEFVDSVELGTKTQGWNGRYRLDIAAFYQDFKGMQTSAVETDFSTNPPRIITGFFNLKQVTIYGVEAELTAHPIENVTASFGGSYLYSRVNDPSLLLDGFPVNGNPAPNAPKWTANGLVRYDIPTDRAGTFGLQTDFRVTSSYNFAPVGQITYETPGYSILNFRLIWTAPDKKWNVTAALENALQTINFTNRFFSNALISGNTPFFSAGFSDTGEPRTWRVSVERDF